MQVLLLTVDSPLEPFGGLGVSVAKLCRSVTKHQCSFFSFGPGRPGSSSNLRHLTLFDGPVDVTYLEAPRLLTKARQEIKDLGIHPNLIHVFDWRLLPLGVMLKQVLRCPIVFTMALSDPEELKAICEHHRDLHPGLVKDLEKRNQKRFELISHIEAFGMRHSDKVVFVSRFYERLFAERVPGPKRCTILNAVDTTEFQARKARITLPGARKVKLLFMGRFTPMKNLHTLLDLKLPSDVDLIIAGGPKGSRPELIRAVHEKSHDAKCPVYHVGFLTGDAKIAHLQQVDAVIVPSLHEPFGIIALEVMASGTPLLCSRSTGMAEFVPSDCCIECGVTEESILMAIQRLKDMSPSQRQAMTQRARDVIKPMTWEEHGRRYLTVYEELLHSPPHAP